MMWGPEISFCLHPTLMVSFYLTQWMGEVVTLAGVRNFWEEDQQGQSDRRCKFPSPNT